ncbi:MAG: hypothetical protein PVF58_20930 [Candidatus Methanofastidiosia archaeon]|jgi:hypothetical protein
MDIEKIVEYIMKHGTRLDVYRVDYLFYNNTDDEIPLEILSALQNTDGGFPYNSEKGKSSGLSETSVQFSRMDELGLLEYDTGKHCITYFVNTQKNNGQWSENEKILQYDPPPWDQPNDLKCDMWLTAQIALHLLGTGYKKEARKAAQFLKKNIEEEKFFGFELTTVLGVSLFSCLGEEDTVKTMGKQVEHIVKKEETPSFLIWYCETMEYSSLEYKEVLIDMCLEKLQNKMDNTTIVKSIDGDRWNIPTTISSLKLLKKYKRI